MKRELKLLFLLYSLTYLFAFISISLSEGSFKIIEAYYLLLTSYQGLVAIHALFLFIYIIYQIIRYFIRVYKKNGVVILVKKFLIRFALPVIASLIIIKLIMYNNRNENLDYTWDHKIENKKGYSNDYYRTDSIYRGMTVYQLSTNLDSKISNMLMANIEWVAIFPFIHQFNEESRKIITNINNEQLRRKDSILINNIQKVHKNGLRVMLKPHLWIADGWRANLNHDSETDWSIWFESYQKSILHYAEIAEITNVELFCIGTELKSSIENQQDKWRLLIKNIREIYKGQLTYAAGWNGEYKLIEFWGELDYIGIQAYFPLTTATNPDLATIIHGWRGYTEHLKEISCRYGKRILFTEIGYRNDEYATIEPWKWGSIFHPLYRRKSDKTQLLAYQAVFHVFWEREWFAGMFPWQWNSSDFPIHTKPSENTLAKWYGKTY